MSSPSVSGAEEQDLTHGDPWELQNTLNLVIKISILSMKTKVFEMRVEVRNDDGFEAFWKITRKEAEFRNLHEKLAIRHKKVRIPRFPGSSLTQKLGSAEKKQKQFQQYLDELLRFLNWLVPTRCLRFSLETLLICSNTRLELIARGL